MEQVCSRADAGTHVGVRRWWRGLAILAVMACTTLAACTTTATEPVGEGRLLILTERGTYVAGSSVSVRYVNRGSTDVYYFCGSELQRHVGGKWRVVSGHDGACDAVLVRLGVGEVRPGGVFTLPVTTLPGEYRLTYESIYDAADRRLPADQRVSLPFEVVAAIQ